MPSVKEPNTGRLSPRASRDLDLVRGLAALAVVLGHWRTLLFVDYQALPHPSMLIRGLYFLAGFGHAAVIVFFVLSGYLVGGGVVRQVRAGRFSWANYAVDRASRLYTVLIPALLLGAALDLLGPSIFGSGGVYTGGGQFASVLTRAPADSLTWSAFLGNLGFLQTIKVPVLGSNGPLWSLANEGWYYVTFPLIWLGMQGKSPFFVRVLQIAGAVIALWFVGSAVALLFLAWLMGAVLAMRPLPSALGKLGVRLGSFVVFAVVAALYRLETLSHLVGRTPLHDVGPSGIFSDLILGLATTLFVACLVTQSSPEAVNDKVSRGLSEISYSCYLLHFPALVLATAACIGLGDRWLPTVGNLGKGIGVLVVVAVYVFVAWWLFERNTVKVRSYFRGLVAGRGV